MAWLRGYHRVPTQEPDLGNASGGRVIKWLLTMRKLPCGVAFHFFDGILEIIIKALEKTFLPEEAGSGAAGRSTRLCP